MPSVIAFTRQAPDVRSSTSLFVLQPTLAINMSSALSISAMRDFFIIFLSSPQAFALMRLSRASAKGVFYTTCKNSLKFRNYEIFNLFWGQSPSRGSSQEDLRLVRPVRLVREPLPSEDLRPVRPVRPVREQCPLSSPLLAAVALAGEPASSVRGCRHCEGIPPADTL